MSGQDPQDMTPAKRAEWLRKQGDRCAERADGYVGAGAHAGGEQALQYAKLAGEWFAAAKQAYGAAYELDVDDG